MDKQWTDIKNLKHLHGKHIKINLNSTRSFSSSAINHRDKEVVEVVVSDIYCG